MLIGVLLLSAGAFAGAARAEDCPALFSVWQSAVKSGDLERAEATIGDLDPCGPSYVKGARGALAGGFIRQAAPLEKSPAEQGEYRRLVEKAASYHANWEASWRLAELERADRDYRGSAIQFQDAVELLGDLVAADPSLKSNTGLIETGKYLLLSADEMRTLAASPESAGRKGEFVQAIANSRDGSLGGVYNAELGRGLSAEKVPAPITFYYDSDRFDEIGVQAADELVELFKARKPATIHITGYTDRKGSAAYNLELSKRRANAVKLFLEERLSQLGVTASIMAEGKGKVPRALSDPSIYTAEQIDQMDRRVEFDWSE